MTLSDVVKDLRSYDITSPYGTELMIFASEPWSAQSEAIVAWASLKGGLPIEAAERRLVRFLEVRVARQAIAENELSRANGIDELCSRVIERAIALRDSGRPYSY